VESGDCKGRRQILSSSPGYVTDGPGNYSVNGNCEWLIKGPSSNYRIILTFTFMETECTYDYLFVYDGDSYSSPLLASLSGNTLPEPIEATSGKMLLHLFSDANYNLLGFNATYVFSLCPLACSWLMCVCDRHRLNSTPLEEWGAGAGLRSTAVGEPPKRRSTLLELGLNLLFSGFDLNSALGDLLIYNFTTNSWERKALSPAPSARHSHVALHWNGSLLLFGGELGSGLLANDVWLYNPLDDRWRELARTSSQQPPGLANHAAALVDGWLYVFGGRTQDDSFSSEMYQFHLKSRVWQLVSPSGGKPPAAAGHSMVYHAASRSLIVYGGHRPSTARFSMRVNTTDAFHVDLRYWTTFRSKQPQSGPRERAFHSATVIGNYMVVYGGNVHIHYQEEKCYEDEIFFYHLGCHQWVSGEELNRLIQTRDGRDERKAVRGRYSHVATVMNGNILLIAGGYSGSTKGDLQAYKVPIFVYQVLVQNHLFDYCSVYSEEGACFKDPECTWCSSVCQSYQANNDVSFYVPGDQTVIMWRLFCFSSLQISLSRDSLPLSYLHSFILCLNTSSCSFRSDQGSCTVEPISGATSQRLPAKYFLFNNKSVSLTLHFNISLSLSRCLLPQQVSIVRSTSISLNPSTEMDVTLVYKGFVHPLWSNPAPSDIVALWARIQRLYVTARVSRSPNSLDLEEVGRWTVQQEKETRLLQRGASGVRLFPSQRGNKYAIQVEGYLNTSGNGQTSELTLTWNRTSVPGGSEISFLFLEPFRSEDCALYPSCLACLADQGCGWCPLTNTCLQRLAHGGVATQCAGGEMQLVLSPSNCVLCEDYRDCDSCSKDSYCEWQINSQKKGDFLCSRRGRLSSAVRTPASCPKLCNQRFSCEECLLNSSQCAWCHSTQTCFFFSIYLAKYPYGECRDWYDSVHSVPQCMDCSVYNTCRNCLQNFECGWCGNTDNPTIGRCLLGNFSSQKGYPNCSAAIAETHGLPVIQPAQWSYGVCPDVDECRLQMASCHAFATCKNTFESFECNCNRGYSGDGVTYCNKTCYNECKHGTCSGPPEYTCSCDLGWTSNSSAINATGVECDVDCGCNFHSTCQSGPGTCDKCQDWTVGDQCQLCQQGSFGNATEKGGCQQCTCNGHGLAVLGYCDVASGTCYCVDSTEGEHCEKCIADYYGDPRNGGTCYQECHGRSFLANVTSSALGSLRAAGPPENGLSYCVWVLSTSEAPQPCPPDTVCPSIALTITPDTSTPCMSSYVYAFDGLPNFLNSGVIQSDRSLIGAFCGHGRKEPITVEAVSGLLVVYYEANVSDSGALQGFNATYTVSGCSSGCGANQECVDGQCVCRSRYAGPGCETEICPNNCSAQSGSGHCNLTLGICICSSGFAGVDCGIAVEPGRVVWETLIDTQLVANQASRFLQRMGHTMVEGPDSALWMYGGLSLKEGILGNVYRYSIPDHLWTQMLTSGVERKLGPAPRYFHAAAYVASQSAMYVVGGLTNSRVTSEFWILNLAILQWKQEKSPLLPAVAGHTLTQRRGSSLILIGGYSPDNGFNNKLLEYNVKTGAWSNRQQTGTPPTGLYGHSAVYHEPTDAVYVFGGYRFHVEVVSDSPELYSLYYPNLTWSLLAPSQGRKPLSHFFHVAAIFWDTMVVVGGRTEQEGFSNDVMFYQINCNTWILPNHTGSAVVGTPMNVSIAHAVAAVGQKLFITGGFNGVALGRMVTLSVPSDPCLIFSTPASCNASDSSCVWCHSVCQSADVAERLGCGGSGVSCFPMPRSPNECKRLKTCSECLARHPKIVGSTTGQVRERWRGKREKIFKSLCIYRNRYKKPKCHYLKNSCMSQTFLPLRCAVGMCGRILRGAESCAPSCQQYQQCATCIRQPRCGWCAKRDLNGMGHCLDGGLAGPQEAAGALCDGTNATWAFMACPPENECLNEHHDCNETQNCNDKEEGFECTCKNGYTLDTATGLCKPVCDQGCVNGTCKEPNKCVCHFGYVGENCSVECQCNKHSNCAGIAAQDKCLECFNNTAGPYCEKCRPLFVGSSLNGGTCRPCRDFCRGNSDICITREEYEKSKKDPTRFPLAPELVGSWVSQGPAEDSAICVSCQNSSFGEKCESCLHGYFLLDGCCTKCQCNGHADTCHEIDGTGCPCQNNTETGTCQNSAQSEKKDCYKFQCAKCKDSFHGNPINGHQCYRLISVEQAYCFDPTSQSNCFHEPNIKNLPMGRTVFFGVQPKFTNVDIRVTIDVTFGGVDVYISTAFDTFAVEVNRTTGIHTVRFSKSKEEEFPKDLPQMGVRSTNTTNQPLTEKQQQQLEKVREERTKGLITYITVGSQQTILIVRNVQDRVVITYPHEIHTLKSSRFYIVLLGTGGANMSESQGLLFFRQDQAHIDLFVFFSVFFSCFFLFLSVCVLLWKVKQFLDFRREQRRHIQEMTKMASRPFAKLTVYFEPDTDLVYLPTRQKLLPRIKPYPQPSYESSYSHFRRPEPFLSHLMGYSYSNFKVGPITLEPTDDGMAGVATVLFQLPGGILAPNRACLGSALVTLRHNLQDYCSVSHGVSSSRKGLLSHENLTSMSL
uniref:Multiple EGF like domains 8 n=1 Tax=Latimeria chalumnae TaxID=7897 RepID=H3A6Q1_LATCH